MAGVQASSSSLVHTLYCDHHGWLVNWLRRRVHCVQDASDLAQDTYMRLLRQCPEELQEPRAFLATVARSVLIDHCRRMSLERAYLETLAQMPEPVCPSPEERAIVLQALEQIDRMLDGLGARARSAFLLAQLDGLTYKEVAARLGVSLSSVEKYMAAAFAHCYRIVYLDAAA